MSLSRLLETAMRSVIRARLTTSLCSTSISVVTAVFFGDEIFFVKKSALVSWRSTFADIIAKLRVDLQQLTP